MKKTYLDRLARWARWKLPRQEAESVLADYREIAGTPPRSDEALLRDVGKPRAVVSLLTEPRTYFAWLAVFLLLSLCALVPCMGSGAASSWQLRHSGLICAVLSLAGSIGALLWFRRFGAKERRMPKALPPVLAALVVWCGGIILFNWFWMRDPMGFARLAAPVTPYLGAVLGGVYRAGAVAAALVCVWSLVRARTGDRRWAAVYILSLAAVLLAMESRMLLSTLSDVWDGWYLPFLRRDCALAAVGLVGAGAALC